MFLHLFNDNWKKDAFNLIKSELFSVKDNRFVQYNNTISTHLVCVYGRSQVGKTTLILNLIGIKDEECKNKVSDVLRGGVSRGNSSTSTAIIYSQNDSQIESESNLYGIRQENFGCIGSSDPIEYFQSPQEMKECLQAIRDKVENNRLSNNVLFHIFIPKEYFPSSEGKEKISIIDLPGIESRNVHEKAHVESLMTRFIPLSSVCIIVENANEIEDFGKIELPNEIDWKNLPHKYLLVITRAYSPGNIKSYFDIPREKRNEVFSKYIQNKYNVQLSTILRINNRAGVFPLDVGDSFNTLLTKELNDGKFPENEREKDRIEIIQTRDNTLLSLQDAILQNKGEQLLSSIKELHTIVTRTDKNKIAELEAQKEEYVKKISQCDTRKDKLKKRLHVYTERNQEVKSTKENLSDTCQSIEAEISKMENDFSITLEADLRKEIKHSCLFQNKNGIAYFIDNDKIVLNKTIPNLLKELAKKIKDLVKEKNKSIIHLDFYESTFDSVCDEFRHEYEDLMYPIPSNKFIRLFRRSRKVTIDSAVSYAREIKYILHSKIQDTIIKDMKEKFNPKINEANECSKCDTIRIVKANKVIDSIQQHINDYHKTIMKIDETIEVVKYQKEQDQKTLDAFLKYARIAYLHRRNEIVQIINSASSSSEKFLHILYLSMVDRDYRTIINTSNG